MAIYKAEQFATDTGHYHLEDYREQKEQYLRSAEQKAAEIIVKAKQQAKEIVQQAYKKGIARAQEEIDRVRAEAEQQGHAQGIEKGKEEAKQIALQENKNKLDPLQQQLKNLSSQFKELKENLIESAEKQLVESAIDLAESVIQTEVETNKEVLNGKLKKALRHLHSSLDLEIRIHPEDLAQAKEIMPEIQETFGSNSGITWNEDESIGRASIVVSAGQSQVDLRTDLQWKQLLGELKNKGAI